MTVGLLAGEGDWRVDGGTAARPSARPPESADVSSAMARPVDAAAAAAATAAAARVTRRGVRRGGDRWPRDPPELLGEREPERHGGRTDSPPPDD